MSQRGSGLLEFLLVLSIASVVMLGAIQWQRSYREQRQVVQMQQSLDQVLIASVAYFFQQCRQQGFDQRSLGLLDLIEAGVLPTYFQNHNPWGRDFDIVIDSSVPDKAPSITVTQQLSHLPGNKSTDYYHQIFAAKGLDGEFIWQFHPNQLLTLQQGGAAQLSWQSAPLPLHNTSVSTLWMLKNTLQGFKQDFSDPNSMLRQSCFLNA